MAVCEMCEDKRADYLKSIGLGEKKVKKVLERHGAAYGVESAIGIGSTFWFELPLCED